MSLYTARPDGRTELERVKERLSSLNHQLSLCMKEQEILENERQRAIERIKILEAGP